MSAALDPELEAGLRRLRLRGMRELAPELLQTAKTQRWAPQELLATLVREEIASREASNQRARLKAAGFPAPKTLEGFDLKASALARATFEFLASLEWLQRKDNLCLAGPAGVGKSHLAQALGRAAITAGHKVRFYQADQLIEALYRGLADNTVGKLIERLLRHELIVIDDLGFTALDRVAADHLFRFIAAAYEQRSVAITTNVDFERWTQFLPDAATATAILDRFLHHCHVIALEGESFRLREAREVRDASVNAPKQANGSVAPTSRMPAERRRRGTAKVSPRSVQLGAISVEIMPSAAVAIARSSSVVLTRRGIAGDSIPEQARPPVFHGSRSVVIRPPFHSRLAPPPVWHSVGIVAPRRLTTHQRREDR